MKKRCLALLLALIQCFSLLIIPANATEVQKPLHFELAGPAEAVHPGDSVTVTVSLKNNPGIAAIDLVPTYDKKNLTLVSMAGVSTEMAWTTGTNAIFVQETNTSYTGETLKLNFTVNKDAAVGDYPIGLTVNMAANANEELVESSAASATIKVEAVPVTGITLDKTELTVNQGETATLVATVLPEDAGDKTVTWTTSADSVATVAGGVVTAVGPGSATITAKAGDFEATCAVTVAGANVPVTGITLSAPVSQMLAEDQVTITATITPDYATDKTVTWTSSSEAVATVDANGVVTGVAEGSVTITATAGEVSATKSFSVWAKNHTATADGKDIKIEMAPKSWTKANRFYLITVPAGTKTVGITGVGPLRFVNYGNKNPQNGDCPAGMTYEDGVLYMDLDTYTRNDSYMADHYGLTYDKYTQRSLEFWGASNWNMTNFFVVIEPCEGAHTWVDATCTEPKHCSVCGTIEGEALGHDWVVTTPEVPAVCETPGTTAIESCNRDGCDTTQGGTTIAAPGHAWRKVMDTKQPTCEEQGETLYTCTTCPEGNAATKTEPIAALGHTWDKGTVTTQPTCTENGVKTFKCTVCEDGTKTEDVPANGHNYVDGFCTVENCGVMEPILIPLTTANHTNTGSPLNSNFNGVKGLQIEGIKVSDWTEWGGGSSLNKSITIYVDPVYKNDPVTIRLLAKSGYASESGLFASPVTVQLADGVGEHLARTNKIQMDGLPEYVKASFGCFVYFKLGECTGEHTWEEATCTEPKTCSVCGKTEGEALGHSMDAATSTCTACGISNTITKIEVSHPNLKNNTMTMAPGVTEQITATTNAVDESVASTQMVAWFSSVETVATVDQTGKITALAEGTTTITAKAVDPSGVALLADGEEVQAQFTLTVANPAAGYTITMGADVENALIGSTVSVPITVGHTGEVTKYNAFDFTFTYDPAILELTSTEISGMTVTAENGQIHVERYGTDLTVGAPALTLTFNAIATGNSNVKVTSAKVDIAEAALNQDAPDASVIDDLTQVSVSGYTVTLPEEFKGESSVLPGEDYTFTAKDKNYNYTVTAKIGEDKITVTDNGDGTFTIPAAQITGNLDITTKKEGKTFNVTLGEDMTGAKTAQYMAEGGYTATLTKASGFNYTVEITIGGDKFNNFNYDTATGVITIPAEKIIGDIVFNTNKTAVTQDKHNVSIGGNSGDVTGAQEVTNGDNYTFTIAKEVGYTYVVSATMNGEAVEVIDNGDGTYTIKGVTGDLEITVTKTYDMEVEVNQYVGLDGKVMFLVTAKASVDTGKALAYAENAMYYSEVYGAWSWLVITKGTLTVEAAKAEITLVEAETVTLTATKDVNESTKVDINDAQLVFDMYNNEYQTFETATMQKFLKADVTGDKAINVNDAAAIVADIIAAK